MTAAEEGVLLLCCGLGDPDAHPLTMPQYRELGLRVFASQQRGDSLRELNAADLTALGYAPAESERILRLLNREPQLRRYLQTAEAHGVCPLTRVSPNYPAQIIRKRKLSSPPVLFCRGDISLLAKPSVALVGSRRLNPENAGFARQAGRLAAEEGLVLVSGGAQGADLTAQNACTQAGGSAVVFVADALTNHAPQHNVLFCSEDGFSLPFSAARALHRNALIHMQGMKTLVAQTRYGVGGTWRGSLDNLQHGWSPLFVYDDGTDGARALIERGGSPVHKLEQLSLLQASQHSLFDPV